MEYVDHTIYDEDNLTWIKFKHMDFVIEISVPGMWYAADIFNLSGYLDFYFTSRQTWENQYMSHIERRLKTFLRDVNQRTVMPDNGNDIG